MNNWRDIWAKRRADSKEETLLLSLLRQNGYDILGAVSETPWRDYVQSIVRRLGLQSGDSIFDVGCGAGAFLWCLIEGGYRVGGIDYSEAQVARARECLPSSADLTMQEAAMLSTDVRYDAVIASGTFLYFPDLAYTENVLRRMAKKTGRCLALLDLPDLALKEAIIRNRKMEMGEDIYQRRYAGLNHLYYSREWVRDCVERLGFRCVIENQILGDYSHAPYRFNAFAWKTE